MKINVRTQAIGHEIHQKTERVNDLDGTVEHIEHLVLRTKEDQIRLALIDLGWTPPPDDDQGAPR